MNDHAIDSMIYAWTAMKEKEATKMIEGIKVGICHLSSYDMTELRLTFLPKVDDLLDNVIPLKYGTCDYMLVEALDITKANDEIQSLRDRVKELEDQLADTKKETDKKLCEAYMGMTETFYKSTDKLISIDKMITELKKERDYWKDRFGSVIIDVSKTLEANGVEFTMRSIDGNKWNVIIDIPELKEMKNKVEELQKRGDYWKGESDAMTRNYHNLEKSQEKRWSAMLQALKEKGVEVLYMGEEDGKPNIDVKIPEIGDLKKELKDLKSKTVAEARYEWKDGGFALIYTMCDGSKKNARMDLSESIDATVISCGTIPKCKDCIHYLHTSRSAFHWCYKINDDGKKTIRKLVKEEYEGPACDKFVAKG